MLFGSETKTPDGGSIFTVEKVRIPHGMKHSTWLWIQMGIIISTVLILVFELKYVVMFLKWIGYL